MLPAMDALHAFALEQDLRRLGRWLARWRSRLSRWMALQRQRRQLAELDAATLKDLGLDRADAWRELGRPFRD